MDGWDEITDEDSEREVVKEVRGGGKEYEWKSERRNISGKVREGI